MDVAVVYPLKQLGSSQTMKKCPRAYQKFDFENKWALGVHKLYYFDIIEKVLYLV